MAWNYQYGIGDDWIVIIERAFQNSVGACDLEVKSRISTRKITETIGRAKYDPVMNPRLGPNKITEDRKESV